MDFLAGVFAALGVEVVGDVVAEFGDRAEAAAKEAARFQLVNLRPGARGPTGRPPVAAGGRGRPGEVRGDVHRAAPQTRNGVHTARTADGAAGAVAHGPCAHAVRGDGPDGRRSHGRLPGELRARGSRDDEESNDETGPPHGECGRVTRLRTGPSPRREATT